MEQRPMPLQELWARHIYIHVGARQRRECCPTKVLEVILRTASSVRNQPLLTGTYDLPKRSVSGYNAGTAG